MVRNDVCAARAAPLSRTACHLALPPSSIALAMAETLTLNESKEVGRLRNATHGEISSPSPSRWLNGAASGTPTPTLTPVLNGVRV